MYQSKRFKTFHGALGWKIATSIDTYRSHPTISLGGSHVAFEVIVSFIDKTMSHPTLMVFYTLQWYQIKNTIQYSRFIIL